MAKGIEREQLKYLQFLTQASEKKKMSYMATLTLIFSIVLIAFAIRPTILTIDRINKEVKEKQKISSALSDKIEALSALDQQYIENESSMKALELLFPTSGNFSLFLSNIDSVVARNGFQLRSVGFSEYGKDLYDLNTSVLSPWAVRMSVKGSEANLIALLRDLEEMPISPVIDSLSFGKTEDDGSRSFSIAMRIYHIKMNKFYD
jgi:Tfp pilus assembly protein PilO